MVEEDLGEATIVYEHPEEGLKELTVQNEYIAYFQDHWIFKTGEDERGEIDRVRRVPATRVVHVERSVEEFQDEVSTVKNQVRSLTEELRELIPMGGESGRRREGDEPVEISVESEPAADTARGGEPDDVDTSETDSN
ncbi:hypothetical protein ACKVMT_09170 [Halobacteriales archaeon Cl-PHB]